MFNREIGIDWVGQIVEVANMSHSPDRIKSAP